MEVPNKCSICSSLSVVPALEADSMVTGKHHCFLLCENCRTLFDSKPVTFDYVSKEINGEEYANTTTGRFYVEIGAGLHSIGSLITLISNLNNQKKSSETPRLIEVGSGFGFAIDMARMLGWEAKGIEPSGMGIFGNYMLELDLIVDYFENCDLPKKHYDFYLSSEVIEHLSDPAAFIANSVQYLKPDGILILTTPNGETIAGGAKAEVEWLEALSPGVHLYMYSPKSMEILLKANNFQDIRIFTEGGSSGKRQMIVVASLSSNVLPNAIDWSDIKNQARSFTVGYLKKLVKTKELKKQFDSLYGGASFRIASLLIDQAKYEEACHYIDVLDTILKPKSNVITDLLNSHISRMTLDEYLTLVPAYLGMYYFYKAMLNINHVRDYAYAAELFYNASIIFDLENRLQSYPRVGWTERAKVHEGLAYLYNAKPLVAIDIFNHVLANPRSIPDDLFYIIYQNRGVAYLQTNDLVRAVQDFAECSKFVTNNPQRQDTIANHIKEAYRQINRQR